MNFGVSLFRLSLQHWNIVDDVDLITCLFAYRRPICIQIVEKAQKTQNSVHDIRQIHVSPNRFHHNFLMSLRRIRRIRVNEASVWSSLKGR